MGSHLILNGIQSPDFVRIDKINSSILPDTTISTLKVPGRAGTINFGTEQGNRTIDIVVGIAAATKQDLVARRREFAAWLYHDSPTTLQLPNDDKYYMAQVSTANIDNILRFGKGTITFLCTDPYAYNATQKQTPFAPIDDNPIAITNNGNVDTYPQIELTFNADTTEFGLVTDDEYLYFGQPAPVDTTTPTPKRTLVLQDFCSNTTGWTAGIGVDNGTLPGSLSSNGSVISATYGSGSTWHGAAGVKSLGQEVQDFSIEYFINFKMTKPNQLGRIELYLLDLNNAIIGKMTIVDPTAKAKMGRIDVRLGNAATGKAIIATTVGKEYYTNFYGRLYLSRIGKKYTFQIGKIDSKGNYFGRWTYTYYDVSNTFQTKLAGLQIHLAQWGGNAVVPTMSINEIRVWNESTLTPTQIPYVFRNGDILFIDSSTGTILKNGEPAFDTLGDLGSSFLKLKPGTTNLSVTEPIISSGTITYTERYL